jgi:hypothetical protein
VLIVALSGQADDFYSDERGILARGPDAGEAADDPQTNYYQRGSEWERPVSVEVFDAAGRRLLHQRAGIRVTGATSRRYAQKSLRLYARSRYDALHPNFAIGAFWPLFSADGTATPVAAIDHIDLRNGGSDWPYTMLTDATMRRLAHDSGLAPVGAARPAAIYLNGRFYGLAWMQPDYCADNLAALCNLQNPGAIEIWEAAEGAAGNAAYQRMYRLALRDLTVPANAAALEAVLDIDNFLLYYILEMYANNDDWPHSNYKAWRYTGATAAEAGTNPYADGRWRFLFYDLDIAFGALTDSVDGFVWLLRDDLEGLGNSPMLISILKNEDFSARFVNVWCRLLSTTLKADNARAAYEATRGMVEGEMEWRERNDPGELFFSRGLRERVLEHIEAFIEVQPAAVQTNLREYCAVRTPYCLRVESPVKGGTIRFAATALYGGQQYAGTHFREAPAVLTCELADGYLFAGWQVNDTTVSDRVLRLDRDITGGGAVQVRVLLAPAEVSPLLLGGMSYRNRYNWLELANPARLPLALGGHTISVTLPDGEKTAVYHIPETVLAGGGRLRVYEQDSVLGVEHLGSYVGDFNLRHDALAELFASDGSLLEAVLLPAKRVGWVYGRNPYAPGWRWYQDGGV